MQHLPRRTPIALLLAAVLALAACGVTPPDDPYVAPSPGATTSEAAPTSASPSDEGMGDECEYVRTGTAARPVELPPQSGVITTGTAKVRVTTTQGAVVITLDRDQAPCTVNAFLSLVEQKFYDDTRCHELRDLDEHLLVCGDPTGTGRGGPGYTVPDELSGDEVYTAGTVALVPPDGPDSGGSQFALVFSDTDREPTYPVFGRMDRTGLGVVNRIAAEGSDDEGTPNNPAEIESITVVR